MLAVVPEPPLMVPQLCTGREVETAPMRSSALAVVGRGKAVCEIRGLELSGRPAFFTYLTVHMYYLSGGGPGHRVKVLIDWISARVGDPQNQVIDGGVLER